MPAVTPALSSVAPSSGLASGGTLVVLTGNGFLPGLTVTFGDTAVPAANVNITAATSIRVLTPSGSGTVTVTVTNPDRQTATASFTYLNPEPRVDSISPISGSDMGGTQAAVAGSNFVPGATVLFGANPATAVRVVNASTIICTTPAGIGAADVTVKNPDGQSMVVRSGVTFRPTLSIAGVTPSVVNAKGGTSVSITGGGFTAPTTVSFGSVTVPAASVQIVSSTQIVVIAPAMSAAMVNLTVFAGGQSVVYPGFDFTVPDATRATPTRYPP